MATCELSLEEMKFAASEVKSLRPVQEAIVKFFKVSTWEEAIEEFKSAVSSEKLLQFAVSWHVVVRTSVTYLTDNFSVYSVIKLSYCPSEAISLLKLNISTSL